VISILVWADCFFFWPTQSTDSDLQSLKKNKKESKPRVRVQNTRQEENQFLSKFTFSCCYWLIALNVHFTLLLVFSFWFLARAQENIKTGWSQSWPSFPKPPQKKSKKVTAQLIDKWNEQPKRARNSPVYSGIILHTTYGYFLITYQVICIHRKKYGDFVTKSQGSMNYFLKIPNNLDLLVIS